MSKYERTETRWFPAVILFVASNCSFASVELGAALGQQYDELNWSIAELDGDPNIVSELSWTELRSNTLNGYVTLREQRFSLRAEFTTGTIVAGKNQDSDYGADDRQCEFSRSNNDADSGSVSRLQLQVGFDFNDLLGARSVITPYAMYLQRELGLKMTDGNQTLSNASCVPPDINFTPPDTGPIDGLNSSYDAEWSGFAVGVSVQKTLPQGLRIGAAATGAAVDYTGKGNWNLRSDFSHPVSFRQLSEGTGTEFSGFAEYRATPKLLLSLRVMRYIWNADAGTSTYYFTNGMRVSTRLNGVNWDGYSVAFGLTGSF